MDLTEYRTSSTERERTADLLGLMPQSGHQALDIGARDGHFSVLMADRFESVTALDLTMPQISDPRVRCIQGNAQALPFPERSFDFVFCAEVLEHVPERMLADVCREIERVAKDRILIGVPYKQDIRLGRTTCAGCGGVNPPWGHVNSFDEQRLALLFGGCRVEKISFVGVNAARTNALATWLMDLAGNPYGTYDQEEACVHCGQPLTVPAPRSLLQRLATRLAVWVRKPTEMLARPHGNWIHLMLRKPG